MEELGAQVAPPMFLHQNLAGRFCDGFTQPLAKKRAMSFQGPGFHPQQFQNQAGHWNSNVWGWDSVGFAAKPLNQQANEVNETLSLKLGGSGSGNGNGSGSGNGSGCSTNSVEETVSRPGKKVRSGSPSGSSYPKCQVDDCSEDLSNAKEYHRRHKVCEGHSKSSKAMVGNQMQRFCQQCSRFHLLTEFDEGKRSCRRRLAGHNKRRRKTQTQTQTQAEDVSSHNLVSRNHDNNTSPVNLDIINLLTVLARAQGTNEEKGIRPSISTNNKDQLIEILRKINSLPLPTSGITPTSQMSLDNILLNSSASSQSTKDLLAVLSQRNIQGSSANKNSKSSYHPDQALDSTVQKSPATGWGGERSSSSYQSPCEDADSLIQGRPSNVPLQLFSSSPEGNSPLTGRIYSSDSSNPMDESSPSSSPPVEQSLFPMHPYRETELGRASSNSLKINNNAIFEKSRTGYVKTSLDLFGESITASESGLYHQGEHTTSSGSDHSPSSLTSESKERTGKIIFKLFDKDPSHLPGTLKTQIYNWLLNSPSDMESYIRPGCVFLSVYLSMSPSSWEQLEENILQRINSLIQNPGTDFWNKGRFLVQTTKQLASHKDGRVRLCKSWRTTSKPELLYVSPLAIMAGKETRLLLKGRNLNAPETKIYCTYMGGYISMDSASQKTDQDEVTLDKFKILGESSGVFGRCFIEVENGFKSAASFPIIIADASICQELKILEFEFQKGPNDDDCIMNDQLLHFLNELGWLFQRKQSSLGLSLSGYTISRFKSLLVFTVDRNCCALVKTVLDLLLERSLIGAELARESLEMLTEIHLLNRAVKRKHKNMIHLLIHYPVPCSNGTTEYFFLPNQAGPGGITPLHLASCMSNAEDIVDALTDDPQEIGLRSWHSLLDETGHSPHAYASMRNNHAYNSLIARKHADRENSQVSVSIRNGIEEQYSTTNQNHEAAVQFKRRGAAVSCSKCAVVTARYKSVQSAPSMLHTPFIHSLLAIAAVCVCVCLFMRGAPDIRSIAPFKWENLDYGCS